MNTSVLCQLFLMICSFWMVLYKHIASCCYDHVWIIQNLSLRFFNCSVLYGVWEIRNRTTFFYSVFYFLVHCIVSFSWSAHPKWFCTNTSPHAAMIMCELFRIYPWGFAVAQFFMGFEKLEIDQLFSIQFLF